MTQFITTDRRWDAIVANNPQADGACFYAVKTTGIYCRPTCKSRMSKPSNVQFFSTIAESEAAGFRPCKRCQPNNEYKSGAKNQQIRFAVENTNLGWVIVAATEIGICAIALGDNPEELANEIQRQFPQAEFCDDDLIFQQWVADVVSTIEIPKRSLNLPLDIQGTAFQQQVWQVLRAIPVGSTLSYQQVATQIGKPKAVRAVASACAANKIAIAIPCHRVVGSNGSLSGYRWGVERKQALLELEKLENHDIR